MSVLLLLAVLVLFPVVAAAVASLSSKTGRSLAVNHGSIGGVAQTMESGRSLANSSSIDPNASRICTWPTIHMYQHNGVDIVV